MLDVKIRNALVADGTGKPAYRSEVGIRDGRIVMNIYEEAAEELDADGLILCPGFIDSHSHVDQVLGDRDEIVSLCRVSQGITTEVSGQCGISPFPVSEDRVDTICDILKSFSTEKVLKQLPANTDFRHYLSRMESIPRIGNYAFNCGHATLRAAVMGMENRKPTEHELERMKAYLREAMENGCLGLSTGLIYPPSVYAGREELIELCRVIKPYHGIYATHMRSEAGNVVEAVREAIYIAQEAQVPLIISHHKICGRDNWGQSKLTLRLIHEAIERGVSVTLDQYPYDATQTYLSSSIPPKYFDGGTEALAARLKDPAIRLKIREELTKVPPCYNSPVYNSGGFSGVRILSSPNVPEAVGLTVEAYAKLCKKDGADAYLDLLVENRGAGLAAYHCLNQEDIDNIYMDENTVVGTDGIVNSADGPVHPRAYGTFVRTITQYVLEKKQLSLEEAIRKQTLLTAERWGLKKKGRIADGYDADLLLLDINRLKDMADYNNSRQPAEGIRAVFINGRIVYRNKGLTGVYPGKCILRT